MDGVVSTPARNTESWTDEDSDGKSLWFRRDGLTVRLMARTKNPPVSLILPLDNCFEVRILRVDNAAGCVFVRPVEEENLFHELQAQLASWSPKWAVPIDIEFLNEEKIYLASDGDEVFRGALIGQPLDKSLLYGIDIGQTRFVDKENICGLPAQLQPIPPLCFCGLLPTGATSEEVIELSMLDIESTYLCKIYKMLPPFFMDHPTSTMPPVLFIQLYKLTGEKNKYVEVVFSERHNMVAAAIEQLFAEHMAFHNSLMAPEICGQQFEEETANAFQEPSQSLNDVQANGDGSSVELKDFQFKQFSAVVPCQVKAIVTERIRYDMYWMRDLEILSNVFESMVNPVEPLANNSYKGEVSCIVRLARPFRSKHVLDRFCVYRAIASGFDKTTGTCSVYLVDFGQSVTCSVENLYSCNEQPTTVLKSPSAAFKCLVNQVSPRRNESKTLKLFNEEVYMVQLTYRNRQGCFEGDVMLPWKQRSKPYNEPRSNTDYGPSSEVPENANVSREMAGEGPTPCYDRIWPNSNNNNNNSNTEASSDSPGMFSSLQQDIVNVTEKMDTLVNAKIASLCLALAWNYDNYQAAAAAAAATFAHSGTASTTSFCSCAAAAAAANTATFGHYGTTTPTTACGYWWPQTASAASLYAPFGATGANFGGIFSNTPGATCGHCGGVIANYDRLGAAYCGVCCGHTTQNRSKPKFESQLFQSDGPFNDARMTDSSYSIQGRKDATNARSGGVEMGDASEQLFARENERWCGSDWKKRAPRDSTQSGRFPPERPGWGRAKNNSRTKHYSKYGLWDNEPKGRFERYRDGFEDNHRDNQRQQRNGDFWRRPRRQFTKSRNVGADRENHEHRSRREDSQQSPEENKPAYYVENFRDRNGKLMGASDEVSEEIISSYSSDDSLHGGLEKLLNKEVVLGLNSPECNALARSKLPKYRALFEHVKVKELDEYLVKRSDDDHNNMYWPLFFVQIQQDDLMDVLEEQLDSLHSSVPLNDSELHVGTLCLSFCHTFESMFRAVITKICDDGIEVFYVDYGNYETVHKDDLKSITDLDDLARTHPGMAIPCMLSSCSAAMPNCTKAEDERAAKQKDAVSCEQQAFRIRVLKNREDGICIVEYIP